MTNGQLTLIGGDSELFNEYVHNNSPCFGKNFSATAKECEECRAPVLADGALCLVKEVCAALVAGAKPNTIGASVIRLTSKQILERLEAGHTPEQIFHEMLNGGDPRVYGAKVRQLLYDRFYYIEHEYRIPIPTIPPLTELT